MNKKKFYFVAISENVYKISETDYLEVVRIERISCENDGDTMQFDWMRHISQKYKPYLLLDMAMTWG